MPPVLPDESTNIFVGIHSFPNVAPIYFTEGISRYSSTEMCNSITVGLKLFLISQLLNSYPSSNKYVPSVFLKPVLGTVDGTKK